MPDRGPNGELFDIGLRQLVKIRLPYGILDAKARFTLEIVVCAKARIDWFQLFVR